MIDDAPEEIIQVGRMDPSKRNSAILTAEADDEIKAQRVCWFGDRQYGPGAIICSAGTKLRCSSTGKWLVVGRC